LAHHHRKAATCLRLMFHDCGNEGNGGYFWDEARNEMLPAETGCDGSILFNKEQRFIAGNQGRIIRTAEGERKLFSDSFDGNVLTQSAFCSLVSSALFENIYIPVNDNDKAKAFLTGGNPGGTPGGKPAGTPGGKPGGNPAANSNFTSEYIYYCCNLF